MIQTRLGGRFGFRPAQTAWIRKKLIRRTLKNVVT